MTWLVTLAYLKSNLNELPWDFALDLTASNYAVVVLIVNVVVLRKTNLCLLFSESTKNCVSLISEEEMSSKH